jgi:general secretion pathway protein A
MYTQFYGLKEKPFNIVSDPSFLYMSPKHRMALTYLEYGLLDGIGFILLTGEIGTGKTTLIKKLLNKIRTKMEVAVVFNTNVSADALLELILEEFELKLPSPGRGKGGTLDVLNQFLIDKHALGQRVLLIVDEAQNLSQEALEEIRMLSNLQTDKASLVQILLVGQPGLRLRLQDPSLAQLSQRIAVSYHLRALDPQETAGYIRHRLKTAGRENTELFSPEAVEMIFEYSGGIPRTINILCDAGLVYGFADELASIEKTVIENVVRDREEAGMMASGPAGGDDQPRGAGQGADTALAGRIESLEQQVHHLHAMLDHQMRTLENRAESYKDMLVEKLEAMLVQERQRADRLMIQNNLLKNRLSPKKPQSPDRRPAKPDESGTSFLLAGDQKTPSEKDADMPPGPGRLRKWFSR